MEFVVVVEGNGDTNDKSIRERQISARVADTTEILLSLTTVKNVMVSMNKDWWHWAGKVAAGRVKGRTIKWVSKSRGREQLSIQWELGIRDDGHSMFLDRSHMMQKYRTCEDSTLKGKFLSDPEFAFTLEAYGNGTPVPNILPKESNRVLQSIIDS